MILIDVFNVICRDIFRRIARPGGRGFLFSTEPGSDGVFGERAGGQERWRRRRHISSHLDHRWNLEPSERQT